MNTHTRGSAAPPVDLSTRPPAPPAIIAFRVCLVLASVVVLSFVPAEFLAVHIYVFSCFSVVACKAALRFDASRTALARWSSLAVLVLYVGGAFWAAVVIVMAL